MTESYERYLPQSKADDLNGQKSSKHDSSIYPDCIPGHRAAGKTPQFYPCGFQPRRSKLAVMDVQIVQNQEHLLF